MKYDVLKGKNILRVFWCSGMMNFSSIPKWQRCKRHLTLQGPSVLSSCQDVGKNSLSCQIALKWNTGTLRMQNLKECCLRVHFIRFEYLWSYTRYHYLSCVTWTISICHNLWLWTSLDSAVLTCFSKFCRCLSWTSTDTLVTTIASDIMRVQSWLNSWSPLIKVDVRGTIFYASQNFDTCSIFHR